MDNQFDFLDAITVASFFLGLENLFENREQSAQNDVGAANERQASFLLDEIGKRLDRQDKALDALSKTVERIERRVNGDTV